MLLNPADDIQISLVFPNLHLKVFILSDAVRLQTDTSNVFTSLLTAHPFLINLFLKPLQVHRLTQMKYFLLLM